MAQAVDVDSRYSTKTFDASAASTFLPNNDFSNERLDFLWYQVGPVSTGPVTTTVSPTPESSASFMRPGMFHPPVPDYYANLSHAQLPDDFVWGLASAAYQVEGAVKDEGRGPSQWDLMAHRVTNEVTDNSTADITAQHYYLYKQDFARLKALGIPYYSLSISWSRIFPFGKGPVNAEAVAHYDDVFLELRKNGITPVVTIMHWDTPLALFNEYGAWTDEQIVDDYFNYAKFLIERYDEYVPIWITINEVQYCDWEYSYYPAGTYYPAYHNLTTGNPARFACGHNTLLAHGKTAKWYHNTFHGKGRITFKNTGYYYEPASNSTADLVAAQRSYDFELGWFGGPWTDGDYPQILKDTLGDMLPSFTEEQKEMIKGSCDFYAIDAYTAYYAYGISGGVEACANDSSNANFPECATITLSQPDGFPVGPSPETGANSWMYSTPLAVRKYLNKITKELFPTVNEIMVTEFGFAEPIAADTTSLNALLWDYLTQDYFQGYLDNILAARVEDGVNVTGAIAWAIFDNFEWFDGMRVKFGLQHLDRSTLKRTPKASMFQFTDWFK
ncbi:glycoside hydrolase family 1 protein [Saccharata proteae CBS 121410]|uniref:Glycoside hydrolase family 1 protein n=1 Tax=Saccharata proteae CBS 121410 TaxID=1314787 RepID=A0A9P4HRF1_9PEZI|nr:glycoside hydrolase family 1 protein [Saccharata proteae CBS 121410]